MKRKNGRAKIVVIIVTLLCVVAAAVTVPLVLTRKTDTSTTAKVQTYTVATGDITNEISAAGNLALSTTEDVAFEMAGTVLEVAVKAGDTVTKGQVLATLDTSDLEKSLKTLQKNIVTAERNVTAKETALANAQRNVIVQERTIADKQMAVTSANLTLQSTVIDLNNITLVAEAKAKVEGAEFDLKVIQYMGAKWMNVIDLMSWSAAMNWAKQVLADAQKELNDILALNSLKVTDDIAFKITQAQFNIDKATLALQEARVAVSDAEYTVTQAQAAVTNAQYDVDDADSALQDAKDNLAETQDQSAVIIAPFDGFVPSVNVKGGDEVMKGTVAMKVADPNRFEVVMSVSEDDISNISVGGKAYVTVDSLDITLPATVTEIAPTATISSGVVNYSVTVQVQSLADYIADLKASFQNRASSDTDTKNSSLPAFSGNTTAPGGMSGMTPVMNLANIKLRQGLTVTAELIISQATGVLVVPYTAVTAMGPMKYVEIAKDDGTTEKVEVTTGITDYTSYEIKSGLTAGEKIVIPSTAKTSATSTTSGNQFRQSGFFMEGGAPPSGATAPGGQ
jgi:multidrug efflux pump subunit AcrA (membrane-fusion protein)